MDGPRAAWLIVTAAALGVVAQLLFYGVPLGLNVPLMVAAVVVAAWLSRPRGSRLDRLDLWLPFAALALASFVALRTDPALVLLDTVGAVALAGASAASFAGVPVMRRSGMAVMALAGAVIASISVAAGPVIVAANRVYRPVGIVAHGPVVAGPVLRGLALALPIVAIFVVLFAAADAVFAEIVLELLTPSIDMGEALGRSGLALAIAWVCAGLLAFVALGSRVVARASTETPDEQSADEPRGWLGTTEAVVVLLSVVVVFAAFVAVQARYLFGGDASIASYGFRYSDYARRGFFELAFVAVLVGALVMTLEHGVRRRTRLFVATGVALCVLTGAVLASAALRMSLYQQAFGWTELRFYVGAAIIWLALGVVLTIGALVTDRSRWLLHGLGVAAVVVTLGANVIGPSQFIASQNLARALDETLVAPGGTASIDERYLFNLSHDAIPVILAARDHLDAADREGVDRLLLARLLALEADDGSRAWQGWNFSRERARSALEAQRDQLHYVRDSGTGAP